VKRIDDIPVIKPFIANNEFFVYDTYRNQILKLPLYLIPEVNTLLRLGLGKYINSPSTTNEHKKIVHLIDKGYFQASHINNIEFAYIDKVITMANRCMRHMILQVTKDCNFKCRYCSYASSTFGRNHESKNMDWNTAQKAIDFLFSHSMDAPEIILSFYGGEPMLNFDVIKKSIEYTSKLFKTKKVTYSITCNGSILSEDHVTFFKKYGVNLLISLDGPKVIQNKNRKFAANGYGTYDVVIMNIKNIINQHNSYFKEYVRFNPVILNKDDQIDVYDFFANNLNLPTEKFAPSIANLSGTDYFAHIIAKDNAKDIFRNRSLETTQNSLKEHNNVGSIYCHGGPCIPGFSKLMVTTDGVFYPCEKVNETNDVYKIGDVWAGFDTSSLIGFFDMIKLSEERCKKCWQIRLCHICPMECGVVEGIGFSFEQKKIKCDAQNDLLISHLKKIALSKGGEKCKDI